MLILLGYVLYRNFAKSDGSVNVWFDKIGFTKKWLRETIVIIVGLAYLFFFWKMENQIELVYVDTDTNTIHLYKHCENIETNELNRTFWFIAVHEGNSVCEDCLEEREWKLEEARERRDELRYP